MRQFQSLAWKFLFAAIFAIAAAASVKWASGSVAAGMFTIFSIITLFFVHAHKKITRLSDFLNALLRRHTGETLPQYTGDEMDRMLAQTRLLDRAFTNTMERLREETLKSAGVIGHMNDGIALLDHDENIILCNPSFKKMLLKSSERECTGRKVREVLRHPELLETLDDFLETGGPIEREMELGKGSGRFAAVSISSLAQISNASRTVMVFHDTTRQKEVERMRVDFVANVSHELRTPLTAIRGFVETMMDGAIDNPEAAKNFLSIIHKHAERLARLINDLLILSDMELGEAKLNFLEIGSESVIKSAVQMFSNLAESRKITMEYTIEENIPSFQADRDKLMQVLINLLDNSIKHTKDGGSIAISCRGLSVDPSTAKNFKYPSLDGNPILPSTKEEWRKYFVEFTVTDNGEGIPKKSLPRVMERFYRVSKERSQEMGGTGLGLSIVKHILIAHKGSAMIESEYGHGTRFRFILPQKIHTA